MYYLLLLLPVLFGAKVLSESDTRIGHYYRFKRRKWKELKEMVSSQYTSTFDIYRVSYQMLLQAMYQDVLSYFDNRVVQKDKKVYEVTYYIEGQKYKLPIKVRRGPSKIIDASNENQECILLELKEYSSPNGSLNNSLVTPKYLGYQKVIITTMGGDTTFEENEPVIIN